MTGCLIHRGPDAQGIFINKTNTIAVGHTRLSIIDLSATANQPFYSANGRYIVVFNGEIYNFNEIKNELIFHHKVSFQTHSDTEVIAEAFAAWGVEMVHKFEGMFAIGIVDDLEKKVFLFRDRIGKKPLFYFKSDNLFVFASEIKALFKHPSVKNSRSVNRSVVNSFLHLGYVPEPDTIYKSVYKFPAGNYGVVDEKLKLSITPYWQVKDKLKSSSETKPENAKNKLVSLLETAVTERLISDVPLGTFLSGGTDSSLITAIASRHTTERLKTFSIGFNESKFDESVYASEVARHLKTDHTKFILGEKEAVEFVEAYLHSFDEPFADTSAIPTMLISKLARKEVKVILTGDGGDELFQGYGAYTWANRLDNIWWGLFRVPLRTALIISGKSNYLRVADLLKNPEIGSIRSHIFSQEQHLFLQDEVKFKLLKNTEDFKSFEYEDPDFTSDISEGEKQAVFDIQYYLKDDLLVKVDRSSMHYALECRSPLLDYHVIEYALSLGKSMKIRQGKTKWLLKEVLNNYLPQKLIDRPKWGFSVPLAKWLRGDLSYLVDEYLNDKIIDEVGLFNSTYVHQLKKEFFSGQEYRYNRLWVLIVLHKWWKENA